MMGKENKNGSKEYLLVWNIRYTLLEKYIHRVIEQSPERACSDEEIAKMLCLTPADVKCIIDDDLLKEIIQGDESRRTIASDFTNLEYGVLALDNEVGSKKEKKDDESYSKKSLLSLETKESLNDEALYEKIDHREIPKSLNKYKAKEYYLIKKQEHSNE